MSTVVVDFSPVESNRITCILWLDAIACTLPLPYFSELFSLSNRRSSSIWGWTVKTRMSKMSKCHLLSHSTATHTCKTCHHSVGFCCLRHHVVNITPPLQSMILALYTAWKRLDSYAPMMSRLEYECQSGICVWVQFLLCFAAHASTTQHNNVKWRRTPILCYFWNNTKVQRFDVVRALFRCCCNLKIKVSVMSCLPRFISFPFTHHLLCLTGRASCCERNLGKLCQRAWNFLNSPEV